MHLKTVILTLFRTNESALISDPRGRIISAGRRSDTTSSKPNWTGQRSAGRWCGRWRRCAWNAASSRRSMWNGSTCCWTARADAAGARCVALVGDALSRGYSLPWRSLQSPPAPAVSASNHSSVRKLGGCRTEIYHNVRIVIVALVIS